MHWSNDTNDVACVANTALAQENHPAGHTAGDCWANHPDAEATCEGHHYDQKKCESIMWRSTGRPKFHWGPEMTHRCPPGTVTHADGSCHCPEGMHVSNKQEKCVPTPSHCPAGEVAHADGSCHCPPGMHWSNDTNDGACVANTALAQENHPAGHTAGDCWANHPDAEATCEGHHYDQKKCESIMWRSTGRPKCHWGPEMHHRCPPGTVTHADGSCHCPEGMHADHEQEKCVPTPSHCPSGEVAHADVSCHCPEGMHWSNDTNDGACVANTAAKSLASSNVGHKVALLAQE